MQEQNVWKIRGTVIKAEIETSPKNRAILHLVVKTTYLFGKRENARIEEKFTKCTLWESSEYSKGFMHTIVPGSIVSLEGRAKDYPIPNSYYKETVLFAFKVSIHKAALQPETALNS